MRRNLGPSIFLGLFWALVRTTTRGKLGEKEPHAYRVPVCSHAGLLSPSRGVFFGSEKESSVVVKRKKRKEAGHGWECGWGDCLFPFHPFNSQGPSHGE